ncbi:MAG: FtsQ-type POTRA domain-containing protein [Anaerolineae bacterium]|nr:FtsQ-type POTRA domain-containing protein [Anaerolineae bacterium]
MRDKTFARPPRLRRRLLNDQPESERLARQSTIPRAARRRLRRNVPVAIPRAAQTRIYLSTRWLSAFIVIILLVVLYLFLTHEAFFVQTIYVGGTRYLSGGEIFARTGLIDPENPTRLTHLFWVDPAAIERRLESDPSIADATVELGWPPMMVQVTVTEREPVLVWEQASLRVWVDARGHVMQLRQDLPHLPRVIVEKPSRTLNIGACPLQGTEELLGPGSCIDLNTVIGVLQFKALYPNVDELVYDSVKGLGYRDGRGWMFWFGDGRDMLTKIAVYNEIVRQVYERRGRRFLEVNVSNPDAPYYSVAR